MAARVLKGVPISPGIAIGRVLALPDGAEGSSRRSSSPNDPSEEISRFRRAVHEAEGELDRLRRTLDEKGASREAMIFHLQRTILADASAREEVEREIRQNRLDAEGAVSALLERYGRAVAGVDTPLARESAADFLDPWRMVVTALRRGERERILEDETPYVLFAEDLAPSIAGHAERPQVIGLVTERGGRFSHGAVLARTFGIPAVSGIDRRRLRQGATIVVNGDDGIVLVEPTAEELAESERRRGKRLALRERLASLAREPATTADGERIEIAANIESLRELANFDLSTVDGIGLLRTEFLYLQRSEFPSEDEQVEIYRRALETLGGRPVVFRTLDIGGDKPLPYFKTPKEPNPVLGWRGLRILLQWRDLFLVQLRAILRASAYGRARILLPMVTNLEEVRTVRSLVEEVKDDLKRRGVPFDAEVPLGVMIEVPGAALALRHFVHEVDFVSLGTNDLVQYTLAVDRDNPWVAPLYDPFDPGVIATLDLASRACLAAGRPISVCGEMAGDPVAALLLVGMGIRSLSMSPVFVPVVKVVLRGLRGEEAERIRDEALACATPREVRDLLHGRETEIWKRVTDSEVGKARAPIERRRARR